MQKILQVKYFCRVKLIRAKGECLGIKNRRRTQKAAKSFGETHIVIDPEISEWGNPAVESTVIIE